MSFFREQKTCINDQAVLLKTLEGMGYKPVVHDKKVDVRGHGNELSQAEIILRKEDLGDGGDIGFSKDKDGNFGVVTDTYVMRKIKLSEFTKTVTNEYSANKVKAIAKKNNWTPLKTKEVNGKTVMQFMVNA